MKNIIWLVLIGLLLPWNGFCQRENMIIHGDRMPEQLLKIENYSKKEVQLSDFEGKVVLLVTWGITDEDENSQPSYWPMLNELQKKHQEDLQIILMNLSDEEQEAKAYFESKQKMEENILPVLYSNDYNDELKKLFFLGKNFTVWIDPEGHYTNMTGVDVVVEKNIQAAINFEPINKKINEPPKVAGLEVGDAVPDYTFTNLVNYPTNTLRLSDFKGKLVILDFWSTYCSACIAFWPKLLELQEEFGDKIQIILVTWQDKSLMNSLFERRKKIAGVDMTLPAIYGDTVLTKKLFPHSGVPHIVWIDDQGLVGSITSGNLLTAKNIRKALREGDFHMPQKINNDEYIDFEQSKPIFVNGNGNWDRDNINVLWQSFFSTSKDRNIRITRSMWIYRYHSMINIVHGSIKDLYAFAYNDQKDSQREHLLNNQIVLEVKDQAKHWYTGRKDGQMDYSNLYIYQLLASRRVSKQQMLKRMQADLDGNIGLDVRWEKRKKKCLVLSASDTSLFAYKEGERSNNGFSPFKTTTMNKITVSELIQTLRGPYFSSAYPILDETGYSGLIGGISMDVDANDHEALNQAFKKYGLKFTIEEREVDVLVLREPEGYVFPYVKEESRNFFK